MSVSSDLSPANRQSAAPSAARQGGCLCGAVRYEITGEIAMSGFCYCLSCQKLTGAGHSFLAMVPETALRATGKTTSFDWTANSGNTVTTSFCSTCGSPLFGRNAGFPGMVSFRVGSLDDSSGMVPQMAVFADRIRSWDHLDAGLTAFPAMPPMGG